MEKGKFKLSRRSKFARYMNDFNVNEADLYRFERENLHGKPMRLGKIILTENWIYSTKGLLLPLKEVVWAYWTEELSRHQIYSSNFNVYLHFQNDARVRFDIDISGLNYILMLLAERCPNAEISKFSRQRHREWKQNAKQWRAQHR